jgi:hypothetical protein
MRIENKTSCQKFLTFGRGVNRAGRGGLGALGRAAGEEKDGRGCQPEGDGWKRLKKKSSADIRGALSSRCALYLDLAHIGRLGAFLALDNVEADAVAFGQGFETVALNFGKVDKDVGAVVLLDETKTFCVVKPLDSTFSHFEAPFFLPAWEFSGVVQISCSA